MIRFWKRSQNFWIKIGLEFETFQHKLMLFQTLVIKKIDTFQISTTGICDFFKAETQISTTNLRQNGSFGSF